MWSLCKNAASFHGTETHRVVLKALLLLYHLSLQRRTSLYDLLSFYYFPIIQNYYIYLLQLWTIKTGWGSRPDVYVEKAHADDITGLKFSTDGQILLSRSMDATLKASCDFQVQVKVMKT